MQKGNYERQMHQLLDTTNTVQSVSASGWLRGVPGATAPVGCREFDGIDQIAGVVPRSLDLLQTTFATAEQLQRGAR